MTKQMSRAELNVLLATTHASIRRIETGRNLGLTVDDWARIQREARRNKTLEQRRAEFQAEVKEGKRLACVGGAS